MSKRLLRREWLLLQAIVWIVLFLMPLVFSDPNDNMTLSGYLIRSIWPLAMIFVFYVNYLWLAPQYINQHGDKRTFWIVNVCLVVAMAAILGQCNEYGRQLSKKERMMKHHIIRLESDDNMKNIYIMFVRDVFSLSVAAAIANSIIMYQRLKMAELARKEAEAARADAELKALRWQINPHFLLNTLNNIYALAAFDTDKAQSAIMQLGKMLRHILYDNQQQLVNLRNEVEFLHNYINLMKIRLSSTVDITEEIKIPNPCSLQVAPLIFISLIENAFKHGVSSTEHSYIKVKIIADTTHIICDIENSYHPKTEQDHSGHGIGLLQVQRRLDLSYPGSYEWKKEIDQERNCYQSKIIIYDTKLRNH